MAHMLPYSLFGPHHAFGLCDGFASHTPTSLAPVFPFPAHALHTCPHSSVMLWYRNLHLLSIDYASRPRLRPRLTQSRSALLWKPWIFGRKDSHSLFLTVHASLPVTLRPVNNAPLPMYFVHSRASAVCFSPGHFRRGTSRLVSYYALFECMAASKPTS